MITNFASAFIVAPTPMGAEQISQILENSKIPTYQSNESTYSQFVDFFQHNYGSQGVYAVCTIAAACVAVAAVAVHNVAAITSMTVVAVAAQPC